MLNYPQAFFALTIQLIVHFCPSTKISLLLLRNIGRDVANIPPLTWTYILIMHKIKLECRRKTKCKVSNVLLSEEGGRSYRSGSAFFIAYRACDACWTSWQAAAGIFPVPQRGETRIDCIVLHAFTPGNLVIPSTDASWCLSQNPTHETAWILIGS